MANKALKKIQDAAERLREVRLEITAMEEAAKINLQSLRDEREAIQAVLLLEMSRNELKSIKTRNGESLTVSVKRGVEITNEALAFSWCIENRAVKPDLAIAAQILKEMKDMPPGFLPKITEFISVRKSKADATV